MKSSKLPSPAPRRASLRADDAHRHGLADAERVADREHDVADADLVGVAERQRLQVGAVDLQHRQVARLVGADDLRLEGAAVGQFDADLLGAVDHVVVGEDVAVRPDDDAGAEAALAPLRRLRPLRPWPTELIAEELAELVRDVLADVADAPLRADGHDRRA